MRKMNNKMLFNHELSLATTQFEAENYGYAKIHLHNAIGALEELQREKNKQVASDEMNQLLDEVAQDPDKLKILKRVVEAYE